MSIDKDEAMDLLARRMVGVLGRIAIKEESRFFPMMADGKAAAHFRQIQEEAEEELVVLGLGVLPAGDGL